MQWNWQKSDWPSFSWQPNLLKQAEDRFLMEAGALHGIVKHLDLTAQQQLRVETMSTEALTTSEIEGEILERASVQSSIRRQLGLPTENRRVAPAERGIADLMVDLLGSVSEPLSHETLFRWNQMIVGGRRNLHKTGRYRSHLEPMQVVSGAVHAPKIHFEAPPSSQVVAEMTRFIDWFERTAPNGAEPLPALTRSGIAHLYFVSIHPFEDGNGRVGRAITEKSLAQTLGLPAFAGLAAAILSKRASYYTALEAANKKNEITQWLIWSAATTIEAQRRTIAQVEFVIAKTRLLDAVRGRISGRQEKAVLRMLREGPHGFQGGLSAANYRTITGASPATATRDLVDLTGKHVLSRTGEHKHARYHLDLTLNPVLPVSIDPSGNVIPTA